MSILIRGMEMPTDCAMLLKIFPDGSVGVPVHLNWMGTMVVNDAEAVPVPPHGRLGDLDALRKRIEENIDAAKKAGNHEWWYACTVALDFALAAPAVIDAEEGEA